MQQINMGMHIHWVNNMDGYLLHYNATYLLFALQLLLNLPTKLGQQYLPALWHQEQLRIDEIFNAGHFGLRQTTQRDIPNDLQNITTAIYKLQS